MIPLAFLRTRFSQTEYKSVIWVPVILEQNGEDSNRYETVDSYISPPVFWWTDGVSVVSTVDLGFPADHTSSSIVLLVDVSGRLSQQISLRKHLVSLL